MELTDQHVKESLSVAYLRSIAATASVYFEHGPGNVDYGVDGRFGVIRKVSRNRRTGSRHVDRGPYIDYQLKASANWRDLEGNELSYDLNADSYDDVVERNNDFLAEKPAITPKLLLLLILPSSVIRGECATFEQRRAVMKESIYWRFLHGDRTDKANSQVVRFKQDEFFTPDVLRDMLGSLEEAELKDEYF